MSRFLLGVAAVVGLSAAFLQQPAQAAEPAPVQLLTTSQAQAHVAVTPVAYPYRYNAYYGGGSANPAYRRAPSYYGGYYRPYYTRGWRDGYALPLGRRWGAFLTNAAEASPHRPQFEPCPANWTCIELPVPNIATTDAG
ncbi:MAG: hypothetical protein QM775_30405 [Pirellulales bacterium]